MNGTSLHIPTVETERLRLRAPVWSDFDAFAAFRMSDRTKHLGGPCTRTQAFDKLGEIIGHWHLRGYGRWMVADKVTDEPLGVVGCFYPDDWPEPEIAWSVFEQAEGRGIATEAARASLDFAYNTLGWTTAVSCTTPDNSRSKALALRLGATREDDFTTVDGMVLEVYRHTGPEARA
ncbi:Acetyltransferase, GNAT family protein [Sulfitobacter noctilucicola]|uniref:Ribosomal-protein-alanine N-acetyltransferase n=1 Tax=Sulfitobacter noctilucicola TaxID=1342301 RepID=A0A7W6M682_9RHOB|nr:GNAT family N-acetyltransferase [Sulfitobacter noctilucicola]KIN62350.1 Acetyltransferase, GNAT family protein [Sulfitobacter noctilucicola]MBB4173116.1 ribosomal-protein-alanine N-acetyltransferase [Sulfitobacter noctilucicola]